MNKQNELVQKMVKKNCSINEIKYALHKKFGEEAMRKSTLYQKVRLVRCGQNIVKLKRPGCERYDTQLACSIKKFLHEYPYASVRIIAHSLRIPIVTAHRYLTKYLKMKYKVTRWLPYTLNLKQMLERVKQSNELFDILEKAKHTSYRNIITGDQTWILFKNSPSGKWCLETEENPEFEKVKISCQKIMITIVWGVWGFYILDDLPENTSYNSLYFINNILNKLISKKDEIWPNSQGKKIWLHLDNCKVHNSQLTIEKIEKSPFKRTPHPPYSPDLAPSDFYLFGKVKRELQGHMFNDRNELLEKLTEILNKISKEERIAVFKEWQNRCDFIRNHKGIYYKS